MALMKTAARPAARPVPPDDQPEGMMGFLEHLDELRSRLIRSCIAIVIGMAVAYSFVDRIGAFILGPTLAVLPLGTERLQTSELAEGFAFYFDVMLIAGSLIASPVVLFQVWRFIAPGLHAGEKRLAIPFVLTGLAGTLSGAAFAHYVLFPSLVSFFASFDSPLMEFRPRVRDTFTQYKHMLLAMILVFQLPTLALFLARLRIVTARLLWKHFGHAILIIFIAAALLTPTVDPWNQIVMVVPMLAMYVLSMGIAWLVAPRTPPAVTTPHLRLVVAAAVLDQARRRT